MGFSEKLLDAASFIESDGVKKFDSLQAVLYLSLLSTEICLKSLLEQAGQPVKDIKKHSHDLVKLLDDVGYCEVEIEIGPGSRQWLSATRLRAQVVDPAFDDATVGAMIEKTAKDASAYPNEIRYGVDIQHFPPELVLKMAKIVLEWATRNSLRIRVPKMGGTCPL